MVASVSQAPFVDRARELGILAARLETARQGQGSLVLVCGEAGIGKSRLLDVFAERAREQDALVLRGRCTEGDWAPPYDPWVEALGDYARSIGRDHLRKTLGPGASVLARTVPPIAAALPDIPEAAGLGPEEELVRLYDAVARWLLTIAPPKAAVLILGDLQWAGRGSLRILQYVARSSQRARLLIVGSYRDVELDQSNLLAEALPALAHDPGFERIALSGLSATEVAEFIALCGEHELSTELAHVIHAETGGNPFFVRELLRHLIDERRLIEGDVRRLSAASIGELGVPASVQDVVNHRLHRLADATKRMLAAAAAFDSGFAFPVLQAVTELPEESLLDAIDGAQQAGLIREVDGQLDSYEFAHAIVRHALYDQLSGSRRLRLHRRIAETLAQLYAGQEREHAGELAAHYHASLGLPGSEQGLAYALMAAERAQTASGPDRAVNFLRMARDLASESEAALQADVLCKLALAEAEVLLPAEALATVEKALPTLAEAGAEPAAVAQFLASIAGRLKDGGASAAAWEALVERGLALMGNQHDLVWARLMLLCQPIEPLSSGGVIVGRWLGYDPEAVAIARSQGDEDDYATTHHLYDWTTRPDTDALLDRVRGWCSPAARTRVAWTVGQKLLVCHGAIREAAAVAEELVAVGRRHGAIALQILALMQLAAAETGLGAFSRARDIQGDVEQLSARLAPDHWLQLVAGYTSFLLAYYLDGDWPAHATSTSRPLRSAPRQWLPALPALVAQGALAYVRTGQPDEADQILAALTPLLEGMKPTTFSVNGGIGLAAAALWERGAATLAPRYRRLALDLIAAGVGGSPVTCNELTVARMAALTGDMAEAQTYFSRARNVLDANGQRPLRALVDYDEALALIRNSSRDRERVITLIDSALAEFDDLGMEGWSRRSQELREAALRGSRRGPHYPDGLSEREAEVLRLIAEGRSNQEIASALTLSIYTVQHHLANIYAKIGARHRVDATTYAIRHGLTAPQGPAE